MRVVLLTNGQGNQRALANKLARVVDIAAIVISENVPKRQKPLPERARLFTRRIETRAVGRPFIRAWFGMLHAYDELYPRLPATRVRRVRNVNDPETLALLDECKPDAILVSGTNLVGRGVIERGNRRLGVLNLHTGISPYVKGGPNCTNWCLAKGWFHVIGSTMMWIDLGIDTGAIICTERTPLDGTETIEDLHFKVMEHGHEMYVRSVAALAKGAQLPRVSQDTIGAGTTFYTRDWGASAIVQARKNFREGYRPALQSREAERRAAEIRLVALPDGANARR
jgi:methionyl-tRNA formyltransferase